MKSDGFSVVEDESAVIGKLTIPKRFFQHMREAQLIVLKSDEETRVKNIFEEYVTPSSFDHLNQSLERISRRLGGVRFKEVSDELKLAFEKPMTVEAHAGWISALLRYYYDPFYERDLKRQKDQIVFEGTANEILEFVTARLSAK
jgi:tRNA 2-selenouridine synthase